MPQGVWLLCAFAHPFKWKLRRRRTPSGSLLDQVLPSDHIFNRCGAVLKEFAATYQGQRSLLTRAQSGGPAIFLGFSLSALRGETSCRVPLAIHGERPTFSCVATAPQERREQRSWPAGWRAGSPESKNVGQEKATPTLASCAQSLCSRCASLLRGSPTVHPWTGVELAHVLWTILRTFPAQSRHDRGPPNSVRRARLSQRQKPLGNRACVVLHMDVRMP